MNETVTAGFGVQTSTLTVQEHAIGIKSITIDHHEEALRIAKFLKATLPTLTMVELMKCAATL